MPDPRPLTGLFGKVPAHGDFVRRALPSSFVGPWDDWLQAAVAAARGQLGATWEAAWDSAPAWRFALPAGACGPDAVAGVMLPSQDQVGRRFPVTLAALLPADARLPGVDWFDAVEAAALAGRDGRADADALAAAIPPPAGPVVAPAFVLPAMLAASPAAMPAAASWTAADPSVPHDGPPAMAAEVDVLALLGAGATEADAPPAPAGEDALALLLGGAGPLPAPEPMAADGTLAALIGAAPGDPPPLAPAAPSPEPDPTDMDATLAALIGAASPPPPELPGAAADAGAIQGDGVLAGLIGVAAADPPADPVDAPDAAPLGLSGAAEVLPDVDSADLLPETVAAAWPDLQDPAPATLPAEAPAAPEGGGWWTRGGAHVPPMVWPLAALPAPSEFAYLLESAA